MKKILTLMISISLLIMYSIPIRGDDTLSILVHIENAEHMYLIAIDGQNVKVKTIAGKLYTSIACLDNEKTTLDSVDFSSSFPCLVKTVNHTLDVDAQYYVSLNMKKLLADLSIKKDAYDYSTLASLTDIAKKILDEMDIKTIIHYQKYITTDLGFSELYDLYQFYKRGNIKTKFYHLNYFVVNNSYFLFDRTFHLKK